MWNADPGTDGWAIQRCAAERVASRDLVDHDDIRRAGQLCRIGRIPQTGQVLNQGLPSGRDRG